MRNLNRNAKDVVQPNTLGKKTRYKEPILLELGEKGQKEERQKEQQMFGESLINVILEQIVNFTEMPML